MYPLDVQIRDAISYRLLESAQLRRRVIGQASGAPKFERFSRAAQRECIVASGSAHNFISKSTDIAGPLIHWNTQMSPKYGGCYGDLGVRVEQCSSSNGAMIVPRDLELRGREQD
ncbi:hypothetical protein TKK_0013906 [Trichogramma kaykai]